MELELGPLRFGIVGAGRLGLALGLALQQRGLELVHVSSASVDGRARATHVLGVPAHDDPLAATQQVDCVLVCVPDDELRDVVATLATRPASSSPIQLRIIGTSAHGGLRALAPLSDAGHDVGVLHPVASVASHDAGPAALSGAGAAISAGTDAARTLVHAIAHALELHPFDLHDDAWPLHAAACTLASNGPAVLLAAAEELAAEADIHPDVARAAYARLAAAAVDRVGHVGPVASLAGPVLRGDSAAIAAQVSAVRDSTSHADALLIPVIASTANQAFTSGRIDMQSHRELLEAVLDPSQFSNGEFRYRDEDHDALG